MGRFFQTVDDLFSIFDRLVERLNESPAVRDGLTASNLVLLYRLSDFEADLWVDLRGERIRLLRGDQAADAPDPDVRFILTTDTLHEFWNGRLNVPIAFASRKIVAKGSIPQALKLLPVLKPAFAIYRELLTQMGRQDLILSKAPPRKKIGWWKRLGRARPTKSRTDLPKTPALPQRAQDVPEPIRFAPDDRTDDPVERKIRMLRTMRLIRAFEQHLATAFAAGELRTEMIHLSIGQEAVAVGACLALRPSDWINTTHRGHGHILAKGADPGRVMAELYGREQGVCRGRGGSMHVIDLARGVMGSNGIVGAGLLLANGAAWSSQRLASDQVSVVFFGDGATNQGMFHEACNFAKVFNLPVVFVCENNLYGEFTPFSEHCASKSVIDRAGAYAMAAEQVDGNDVTAVYEAMQRAVKRARTDGGPTLLECLTYRWHGHMEGEPTGYRTDDEIAAWKARCPIARFERQLIEQGVLDENRAAELTREANEQIERAVQFAREAPDPDPADAFQDVYAPESPQVLQGDFPVESDGPLKSISTAINEAIAEEMTRDATVVMLGEDVRLGGYFGVSAGLAERFGNDRVLDTPISENAIVGAAVGAAATGLRPICEILFSDFLTTCADPVVNQAAKLRYMSGGQNRVPLVLRTPVGGYIGAAAQHSQCFEPLFVGIPGLIVCAPADAFCAKGILKSAIRSDNPVLFFENKLLYAESAPVPDEDYLLPLGRARVRRTGSDITVVGILYGAYLADLAAVELEGEGIGCEVIDPVTLYPLDLATLVESVCKTGRLAVVEEGHAGFGMGARIVAAVVEAAWDALRAAPVRICAGEAPVPYSKPLETVVLPGIETVVRALRHLAR